MKPLPSLPHEPALLPLERYRDDPTSDVDSEDDQDAQPTATSTQRRSQRVPQPIQTQIFFAPYRDDVYDDDDVPLAQLCPYPTEAPPSYHFAVRESFRATLLQHIPTPSVSNDTDTESGLEVPNSDDVSLTVERFMAALIVSMVLLISAGLLALIALTASGVHY